MRRDAVFADPSSGRGSVVLHGRHLFCQHHQTQEASLSPRLALAPFVMHILAPGCCRHLVLLFASVQVLRAVAAGEYAPEATPESTLSSKFGVYNAPKAQVDVTKQDENGFWHNLEVGNESASTHILEANIAPAVATGRAPTTSKSLHLHMFG